MLYSGRVFAGAAGGVSCVTAPCYVNEISTPDMSGILGIMYTVSRFLINNLTSNYLCYLC